MPFRAAGKLGGLTLKKQFEKAFSENAKKTLDYLMIGSFNEVHLLGGELGGR